MNDRDNLAALIGAAMNQGAKPGTIATLILEAGYKPPVSEMDMQRDPGDEDDSACRIG